MLLYRLLVTVSSNTKPFCQSRQSLQLYLGIFHASIFMHSEMYGKNKTTVINYKKSTIVQLEEEYHT